MFPETHSLFLTKHQALIHTPLVPREKFLVHDLIWNETGNLLINSCSKFQSADVSISLSFSWSRSWSRQKCQIRQITFNFIIFVFIVYEKRFSCSWRSPWSIQNGGEHTFERSLRLIIFTCLLLNRKVFTTKNYSSMSETETKRNIRKRHESKLWWIRPNQDIYELLLAFLDMFGSNQHSVLFQ